MLLVHMKKEQPLIHWYHRPPTSTPRFSSMYTPRFCTTPNAPSSLSTHSGTLLALRGSVQMPSHDLLKDTLTISLHDVSMARDDPVEPPLIDPLHTSREALPITRTSSIPNSPLLPLRITLCTLQRHKDLRQDAAIRVNPCFTELLCSRQIEHEISLYESAGRAVMEDELLVDVRGDVFPIELRVEFGGDGLDAFVGAEEDREGDVFVVLLCALFGEDVGAHDLRVGVFFVPGAEEDVVLLRIMLITVAGVLVG